MLVLQSQGHVMIGGLFPLHYLAPEPQKDYRHKPPVIACTGFDFRAFRWMMTMVFAVEEINGDLSLLPGVKLGYRIMDSCDHVHTSLQAVFSLLSQTNEKTMENVDVSQRIFGGGGASEGSAPCLAGSPVSAVIGLASSSPTRAVAHTVGPFDIPLVSYFATCTCLTNKKVFPSFLRTVPSDLFQVRGLVQLVTFFGWNWISTIGTTDDYSHYGIQAFSQEFRKRGGCVAFHITIPKTPSMAQVQSMASALQSSTARVVVVFATEGQLVALFSELSRRNVTGIQWVASEAWVTATLLTSETFQGLLEGTLGFSFPGVYIPRLKEFLQSVRPSSLPSMRLLNTFWEELFDCKLNIVPNEENDGSVKRNCSGLEDVSGTDSGYTDVSQVRISYNVYKATYAIGHALHQLLECDASRGMCKLRTFTPTELLHHLRKINFTDQFGERTYFDSNGEPVPLYDIINWQKTSEEKIILIKVGSYDGSARSGYQMQIDQSNITWTTGLRQVPLSQCSAPCSPGTRKATRMGQPPCCFDCLPCGDGEISNQSGSSECTKCPQYYWSDENKVKCVPGVEEFLSYTDTMGIILVTLTLLGVSLTAVITTVFHCFRTTPIVKANNSEISFLLLASLKLCFLCSLVFMGQPSVWSCRLRQAAFGVSFVLCLSCLLVKTIVVLLAFRTKTPRSNTLRAFGPIQQRILILCTTAPQVCLCAVWLLAAPPFPFRNPDYQATTGKIVLECREPWPPGFFLVMGYIGLLAFFCLLLAFLGRKLPDTFNEANLISFSMIIFWAVWICFIPAYVSSPGKFTVAVEIFAILASSFGLLVCIFMPKCYIILFRPEKNVKKSMTVKHIK
ncbi:unnamed protein product [Knipowitschia caucasica]